MINLIPEIIERKIKIRPLTNTFESFEIEWELVNGAEYYNLYVSFSPVHLKQKVNLEPLTVTKVELIYPKNVPKDCYFYVWVSYIKNNEEFFIEEDPVSLQDYEYLANMHSEQTENIYIIESDMKYYIEEIRRRTKAVIENSSEYWDLYMRMWNGPLCDCVKADDLYPDYPTEDHPRQPIARHLECFGTGILGGYYKKIVIKGIYTTMPDRLISFESLGIRVTHPFDFITFWFPRLRQHDILVRQSTNERFLVVSSSEDRTWRNIPIAQTCRLQFITQDDFLYNVNDSNIEHGLSLWSRYSDIEIYKMNGWQIRI